MGKSSSSLRLTENHECISAGDCLHSLVLPRLTMQGGLAIVQRAEVCRKQYGLSSCTAMAGMQGASRQGPTHVSAPLQVAVMAGVGPAFGMSPMQSIRSGLLLAAGGEFAFVAFGGRPRRPCAVTICGRCITKAAFQR